MAKKPAQKKVEDTLVSASAPAEILTEKTKGKPPTRSAFTKVQPKAAPAATPPKKPQPKKKVVVDESESSSSEEESEEEKIVVKKAVKKKVGAAGPKNPSPRRRS